MSRGARKRRRQLQRLQQQQGQSAAVPPELAQLLSPSNPTHALVRQWMASLSVSAYTGPLPPPDILLKYNEIEPGLVDRIVKMAENQAQHRHGLESSVILERSRSERLGQRFGFIIALVALVGSFALIAVGKDAIGITGVLGTIASLGAIFVYGRYSQRKENEEKRAAITPPGAPVPLPKIPADPS